MSPNRARQLERDERAYARTVIVVLAVVVIAYCVTGPEPARADAGSGNGLVQRDAPARPVWNVPRIICHVFGPRHCQQAVWIARCESGFRVSATNGQYRGLFQVSRHWRARFPRLWGRSAWAQARHARAVFRSGGNSWQPWECARWV